ncbi:hypothetical protein AB9M93_13535 [Peribacillus frigoritolerans]|uniref:hypothetical protein n=1 Tax=Peribacillus frigoritolerans TaxID=450367 RepID=UPI003512822D
MDRASRGKRENGRYISIFIFFGAVAFLVTAIVFLVEKKFKKALMMLGLMLVSLILFIIAVMFTDIGTEATTEVVEPETVELTATVETATFNKKKIRSLHNFQITHLGDHHR